jgi:predicted site-specific integrase-resolvase
VNTVTIRKGQSLDGIELLSRQDTADYFGVHPATIDNWVDAGLIRPTILGRRVYFLVESIREAMERGTAV